jgi:hypothetical protein
MRLNIVGRCTAAPPAQGLPGQRKRFGRVPFDNSSPVIQGVQRIRYCHPRRQKTANANGADNAARCQIPLAVIVAADNQDTRVMPSSGQQQLKKRKNGQRI